MPPTRAHQGRQTQYLTDAQKGAIVALRCHSNVEFPYIAGALGLAVSTPGNDFRAIKKACIEAGLEPTLVNMLATIDMMSKKDDRRGRPKMTECTSKKGRDKIGRPSKTSSNRPEELTALMSSFKSSDNPGSAPESSRESNGAVGERNHEQERASLAKELASYDFEDWIRERERWPGAWSAA